MIGSADAAGNVPDSIIRIVSEDASNCRGGTSIVPGYDGMPSYSKRLRLSVDSLR